MNHSDDKNNSDTIVAHLVVLGRNDIILGFVMTHCQLQIYYVFCDYYSWKKAVTSDVRWQLQRRVRPFPRQKKIGVTGISRKCFAPFFNGQKARKNGVKTSREPYKKLNIDETGFENNVRNLS